LVPAFDWDELGVALPRKVGVELPEYDMLGALQRNCSATVIEEKQERLLTGMERVSLGLERN
jgi:hypothetical protein